MENILWHLCRYLADMNACTQQYSKLQDRMKLWSFFEFFDTKTNILATGQVQTDWKATLYYDSRAFSSYMTGAHLDSSVGKHRVRAHNHNVCAKCPQVIKSLYTHFALCEPRGKCEESCHRSEWAVPTALSGSEWKNNIFLEVMGKLEIESANLSTFTLVVSLVPAL